MDCMRDICVEVLMAGVPGVAGVDGPPVLAVVVVTACVSCCSMMGLEACGVLTGVCSWVTGRAVTGGRALVVWVGVEGTTACPSPELGARMAMGWGVAAAAATACRVPAPPVCNTCHRVHIQNLLH